MVNRIKWMFEEPERPPRMDFYEVVTYNDTWYVTADTARWIESRMDKWLKPRWVRFVDIRGSCVRIRVKDIRAVSEALTDQRATGRAFFRFLQQECQEETGWGDSP